MSMTSWNPTTHADYDVLKGFEVFTRDNEKLGEVKEIFHPPTEMPAARGSHYFRVEPGTMKKLFSNQDEVFVSESMIQTVQPAEDKIILSVPKNRIEQEDWSRPRNFDTFRRS